MDQALTLRCRSRTPLRGFDTKEAIVGASSNGHADVLKLLLSGFREEVSRGRGGG